MVQAVMKGVKRTLNRVDHVHPGSTKALQMHELEVLKGIFDVFSATRSCRCRLEARSAKPLLILIRVGFEIEMRRRDATRSLSKFKRRLKAFLLFSSHKHSVTTATTFNFLTHDQSFCYFQSCSTESHGFRSVLGNFYFSSTLALLSSNSSTLDSRIIVSTHHRCSNSTNF